MVIVNMLNTLGKDVVFSQWDGVYEEISLLRALFFKNRENPVLARWQRPWLVYQFAVIFLPPFLSYKYREKHNNQRLMKLINKGANRVVKLASRPFGKSIYIDTEESIKIKLLD